MRCPNLPRSQTATEVKWRTSSAKPIASMTIFRRVPRPEESSEESRSCGCCCCNCVGVDVVDRGEGALVGVDIPEMEDSGVLAPGGRGTGTLRRPSGEVPCCLVMLSRILPSLPY